MLPGFDRLTDGPPNFGLLFAPQNELDVSRWKTVSRTELALQRNSFDCGTFVCWYTEKALKSESMRSVLAGSMASYRRYVHLVLRRAMHFRCPLSSLLVVVAGNASRDHAAPKSDSHSSSAA